MQRSKRIERCNRFSLFVDAARVAGLVVGVASLVFACGLTNALAESISIDAVEKHVRQQIEAADKEVDSGELPAESGSLKDIPTDDAGYIEADKIDFLNENQDLPLSRIRPLS